MRVLIAAGGTAGHINPALAIAGALKAADPAAEIHFAGRKEGMEYGLVTKAGYPFHHIEINGFQRKPTLKNVGRNVVALYHLALSGPRTAAILKEVRPDLVIGCGGYVSGPVVRAAAKKGIKTAIHEQNAFPGVTNKLLAKRARTICVSYEGMERFFPKEKIVMTGNPLRGRFSKAGADRREALAHFGFRDDLPVLLVVGGSLGTRTLNEMMKAWVLRQGGTSPVQVIWQTGKYYEREMREFLAQHPTANIWQGAFIDRMDYAYAAADLVVSRSGACTVSELCLVAKPTLFVPSPNVAEDHQTKNARALADKGAALLIPDSEAVARAMDEAVGLLKDPVRLAELSRNIEALAIPDSAERIVNEIEKQLPQSK